MGLRTYFVEVVVVLAVHRAVRVLLPLLRASGVKREVREVQKKEVRNRRGD